MRKQKYEIFPWVQKLYIKIKLYVLQLIYSYVYAVRKENKRVELKN